LAVPVLTLKNVRGIAAGRDHSPILKEDGSLWACGSNVYGQIGNGSTIDRLVPVKVATGVKTIVADGYFSFAIKTDGTLWGWGLNTSGQLGDGTTTAQSMWGQISF